MHPRALRSLLATAVLAMLALPGCKESAEKQEKRGELETKAEEAKKTLATKTAETKEVIAEKKEGFYNWSSSTAHNALCEVMDKMIGTHDGVEAPGTAGAPRWGIPKTKPTKRRVRRSWSSLSAEEKKKVVDAFVALKKVTVDSGRPGAARAKYDSVCEGVGQPAYERNLYDYYVEAHANAFLSMGTPVESMYTMSHMGPQFLPWHRYVLLRIEADIAQEIGDPEFALPYWDWQDCYKDGADPGRCAPLFEREFLGTPGTCDDDKRGVEGYLTDAGFRVNLTTKGNNMFVPSAIVCDKPRVLHRQVGCEQLVSGPATAEDVSAMFTREVYDAAPYDHCQAEEDVSFRQYLEGYDNDDTNMTCVAAGCAMHSRGHIYIGADMYESSGSPNDPMFFLHHANVDRLWAAWQEANIAKGGESTNDHGNPGYPEPYRGSIFVWPDVKASDMFDYKGLGYEYDALPKPR